MSPTKKPDTNKLYTSAEVRKKLEISPSTLTTLVDKGVIEKVVPLGYKNGYYTKESVDEYYRQSALFLQTYSMQKDNKLEIRKAVGEDQPNIFEMEKEVLGATIPLEQRVAFYKKNPDIDFIAVKGTKVVGHLSLFPLPEHKIMALLRGELRGWQIEADDLETYIPGNSYKLFVMAMAADKGEQQAGRIYAGLLLREAQKTLFEMAQQGIVVDAIYATSRTKDGIYLAGRMGMDLLPELSDTHRKAFALDMKSSKNHWTKEYQGYLKILNQSTRPAPGLRKSCN